MHRSITLFGASLLCALAVGALVAHTAAAQQQRVASEARKTEAGERILVQTFTVRAPVQRVWDAYTTAEGWTAWASQQADVDLRVGGRIRTRYDATGKLGEPGTNTLQILNYVPREVLTLRADPAPNWPELLKQDADRLSNVILFRDVGEGRTEVKSYGIGYRDIPEYDALLAFFTSANEGLLRKLIAHLETPASDGSDK